MSSSSVDSNETQNNAIDSQLSPLIPEDVDDDELIASITFSEGFSARYGSSHAPFHLGTLFDALSKSHNKMLALYLHNDHSTLSNAFCTQVLGSENVRNLLEEHFVIWGWDLTCSKNKANLSRSLRVHMNSIDLMNILSIPITRLPALLVIAKIGSRARIFSTTLGNAGPEDLLQDLNRSMEDLREHHSKERRNQEQRVQRELLKKEQDRALEESLRIDIEKARVKKREQEERERKEQEIEAERLRLEEIKQAEADEKEAYRKEVEASLPAEPALDRSDIIKVKFRTPHGSFFERRFEGSNRLRILLDYLIVEGYTSTQYKVISGWPRRNIASLDDSKTLKELQLSHQEIMILEELI